MIINLLGETRARTKIEVQVGLGIGLAYSGMGGKVMMIET
jgi:ATP-dependent Lon protease